MCIRTLFLFTVIFIVCCVTIGNAVRDLIDPREVDCLAKNLYFEARQESTAGKIAVGFVVFNRKYSRLFPDSVCGVIYQGRHNARGVPYINRCQFSWYCDGRSDDPLNVVAFRNLMKLSEWLLFAERWMPDITDGAIFYHALYVTPRWSLEKQRLMRIDNHIFYK